MTEVTVWLQCSRGTSLELDADVERLDGELLVFWRDVDAVGALGLKPRELRRAVSLAKSIFRAREVARARDGIESLLADAAAASNSDRDHRIPEFALEGGC